VLTHIVLFKLKEKTNVERVKEKLLGMKGKIPQLRYLEVGIDVSKSERSYDLAVYTKFDSLEAMQEYQIHPVHVEVSAFIKPVRESSISVDYLGGE
jgi:hypothetical protein